MPLLANPASFARPPGQKIWLDEARLVAALQGLQWSTYYEGFRGDTALAPATNYLANMREEVRVRDRVRVRVPVRVRVRVRVTRRGAASGV